MTQPREKQPGWRSLVLLLATTLVPAGLIAFLLRDSMAVYATLAKPSFAPPAWVFPVVWTVLYAAMALSMWFILRANQDGVARVLVLYYIQLIVNLVWPILFFMQKAFGLSFVWLVLLLALVLLLTGMAFSRTKVSGWLLVPYAAWITFAGVLNFTIARMNP